MSKIIVFVEGAKVTGYEVVKDEHVRAAILGLFGDDAVTYERAEKQLGGGVMATLLKNLTLPNSDDALKVFAAKRERAFVLVDRLPDTGEFEDWEVSGGNVVLKA